MKKNALLTIMLLAISYLYYDTMEHIPINIYLKLSKVQYLTTSTLFRALVREQSMPVILKYNYISCTLIYIVIVGLILVLSNILRKQD